MSCYAASVFARSITTLLILFSLCRLHHVVDGEVVKGINGLDKFILREPCGSSAEIYLYGSQVTSWKNTCGEELLLLSSKAIFEPPKPIRGGIHLCFPQYTNHGPIPESHGFARNRVWSIDSNPPPFPTSSAYNASVDLILKPSPDDLKLWPNSFEFRNRIALGPGGDLIMTSRIRNTNTDGKPFNFTFAYHPYFAVSNISEVRVEGLKGLDYLDQKNNFTRSTDQGDAITFQTGVDRIYLSTPANISILDNEKKRTYVIHKDGLPGAVVWNPWEKPIFDLGVDDHKHFVAVEPVAVENPIVLKPGEEWTGSQQMSSSSCSGQLHPRKLLGS